MKRKWMKPGIEAVSGDGVDVHCRDGRSCGGCRMMVLRYSGEHGEWALEMCARPRIQRFKAITGLQCDHCAAYCHHDGAPF